MKTDVLKSKQKELWPGLKAFKDFCLVGGTALALQMEHRVSVDFDLSSEKPLSERLYVKIKREFLAFPLKKAINLPEQLSVLVNDVKIDFVYDKFKFIQPAVKFQGVQIATIAEIAAMKAFALSFRGSGKDYIDLYFILREEFSNLEEIEKIANKKYGDEFNFKLFLEQLIYLDDIGERDIKKIEFLGKEISKDEMLTFFRQTIKKVKL